MKPSAMHAGSAILAICVCTTAHAGAPVFAEEFESYSVEGGASELAPQSGWFADWSPAVLVADINAIEGRSGRTLAGWHDPGLVMESPAFAPTFGEARFDIVLGAPQFSSEAAAQVTLIDTKTGLFLARIDFIATTSNPVTAGVIRVGQVSQADLNYTNTGEVWTPGQVVTLFVRVGPNGSLSVARDQPGNVIFTGAEIGFALRGRPGRIGQIALWSAGEASASPGQPDGSGAAITIDNIVVTPDPCPFDVTRTGAVGSDDLGGMLSAWGDAFSVWDFNDDGRVDGADLGLLLGAWGACPG